MTNSRAIIGFPDWRWALWLISIVAVVGRLWGTWYGLPFSYYNDEYHEVYRALELGSGGFNLERTGKGGFYFVLFFEYGLYYVLLRISGAIETTREFAEMFVRDPSAFYLMGRVTAALVGSLTVVAAFYVARQAYQITAGLTAALLLAVNILHIKLSRLIGVDIPMTLFAALALYFGVLIAAHGRRRDYAFASICAALATTTKLPGILAVVPLLIAHTYWIRDRSGGIRAWIASRDLWLAGALFALVLVMTNPGIIFRTDFLSLFTAPPDEAVDSLEVAALVESEAGARPNLYLFYLNVLRESMGWPLFVLSLFGILYAVWKHRPPDVMLLSFAVVNYVAISGTTSEVLYYPRYTLPILVVLTVLAGRAFVDLVSAMPRWRAVTATAILAGCLVLPVKESIATAHALIQVDTRTIARAWFEANVPSGSRVLIEGLKIAPVRETVPLHETREAIARRMEYWKAREPKQAKFLEFQLAAHAGGGYELEFVRLTSLEPLEEYLGRGIEYFVIRPEFFAAARRASAGAMRLISELRTDDRIVLMKRLKGDERSQLGPTIEIYGLHGGRAAQSMAGAQ